MSKESAIVDSKIKQAQEHRKFLTCHNSNSEELVSPTT